MQERLVASIEYEAASGDRLGGSLSSVLKKAKYWQEFTAGSQVAAEEAAAAWWAKQIGFDKVCGWTLPTTPIGVTPQWTVTIVYKESDSEAGQATLH